MGLFGGSFGGWIGGGLGIIIAPGSGIGETIIGVEVTKQASKDIWTWWKNPGNAWNIFGTNNYRRTKALESEVKGRTGLTKFEQKIQETGAYKSTLGEWGAGKLAYNAGREYARFVKHMGLSAEVGYYLPWVLGAVDPVFGTYAAFTAAADKLTSQGYTNAYMNYFYDPYVDLLSPLEPIVLGLQSWEIFKWFPASAEWTASGAGGNLYNPTTLIEPWEIMNKRETNIDPTGFYVSRYFDGEVPAANNLNFAGIEDYFNFLEN